MGLKQIKDSDRISFLNMFTMEMLINVSEKYRLRDRIEVVKLKQKLVQPSNLINPTDSNEDAFKIFLENRKEDTLEKAEDLEPSQYSVAKSEYLGAERKQIVHRQDILEDPEQIRQEIRKKLMLRQAKAQQAQLVQQFKPIQAFRPMPMQTGQPMQSSAQNRASGYSRIGFLLKDPVIQLVECSGPGKNLLIRRYNKTNVTKISLGQDEIMDVINEFSNQARIPIVGGILKAAIGNMMISAVVSDFVGSRFIITKATPYSLIYK